MTWIGDWRCRRGWHKFEDYIGIDYNGKAIVTVISQCCERCKHVVIIGVEERTLDDINELGQMCMKQEEAYRQTMQQLAKEQIDPMLREITGDPTCEVIFKNAHPTVKELFNLPLEEQPNTVYGIMGKTKSELEGLFMNPPRVAMCCFEHEEGEMLFHDSYHNSLHTKGCILKEIDWLMQHMPIDAEHASGLTAGERIDQLNKSIGCQTREELCHSMITSGDNWTYGEPNPKKDIAEAIKGESPVFRDMWVNAFDPEGKVWNDEERKDILKAPTRFDPSYQFREENHDWKKYAAMSPVTFEPQKKAITNISLEGVSLIQDGSVQPVIRLIDEMTNASDSTEVPAAFDDYKLIGEVSKELGMQTQYVYHYVLGLGSYPNLSAGLRFVNPMPGNYHAVQIHKDDMSEFIRRIRVERGDKE